MFGHKARRIKELEERLREMTDPKVLEAHLQDGTIDLRLSSPVARIIAAFFWAMLEGTTTGKYAPNCVQVNVIGPDGQVMEITARRAHGRMPNELLAEAQANLERAVRIIESCAGNLPNVKQNSNTDEFMAYLKELYDEAATFVDAYRKKYPRQEIWA